MPMKRLMKAKCRCGMWAMPHRFRREAGAAGKDTEGIIRMHQFNKMEMESFTTAENSLQEHLLMGAIQEYLMAQLNLPYRVLMKCTIDIGKPNARGTDVDVWFPSQINTARPTPPTT